MTAEPEPGTPAPPARLNLAPPFRALLISWLRIGLWLAPFTAFALRNRFLTTEAFYFWRQDLPVFGLCLALTAAVGLVAWTGPNWRIAASSSMWPIGLAALTIAIGVAGTPLIFGGYAFSLDEFLADFDARIFEHGQLFAPIAPAWRPFVPALQPLYLLPIPDHSAWASGYLPVNAGIRALAGLAGLQGWVSPLWSAISVLAVWAVARRLWPERPGMAVGAAALLASSSQLSIMSMTAYAMPAHLALNLVWLWCFLRGGTFGNGAAVVIGFAAAGLHQFIFHPLFAAPFVLQLWLDRRWRLAGFYTLAYAAICLFWADYWPLDMHLAGLTAAGAQGVGAGSILTRLLNLFSRLGLLNIGAMAESLTRFVTWQNPLTAPLAVLGALAAWRAKGNLRALLLGVVFTLAVVLCVAPTQSHGWGYRYLHGPLGSVCLVAVWTWTRLTDDLPQARKAAAETAFVIACALSLLVLTPLRAWQAWSYVRPYAAANAAIQASAAPVVLVDDGDGRWFDMGALVRNDPYLERGPKVMRLADLTDDGVRQVCAAGPVAIFDGAGAQAAGIDLAALPPDPTTVRLRALMSQLRCGRPMP